MKYKNKKKNLEARLKAYQEIQTKVERGMIPVGAFKKPGSLNK